MIGAPAPIGVLAEGSAGRSVVTAVARVLPREDVILLADTAYAPYAGLHPRVVADRVSRLADDLVARGVKLIVLASLQAYADAAATLRAAVPVVDLRLPLRPAAALCEGKPIAVVVAGGTVRGRGLQLALRAERSPAGVLIQEWRGLRELVEAEADPTELVALGVAALREAGAGCIALADPWTASVAALVELPHADCATLAAERVRATLRASGLLARRTRAGYRTLVSTDPVTAATS